MTDQKQKVGSVHLTVDSFDKVIKEAGEMPVMVDFYAEWCGPCRMVAPVIEELADEMQGKAIIAKVNVDEENELAGRHGVMSIPTVIVVKNGKVVESRTGASSKDAYIEMLDKHMGKAK